MGQFHRRYCKPIPNPGMLIDSERHILIHHRYVVSCSNTNSKTVFSLMPDIVGQLYNALWQEVLICTLASLTANLPVIEGSSR